MENARQVGKITFFDGKRDADELVRIDKVKGFGIDVKDGEYSRLNPQFHGRLPWTATTVDAERLSEISGRYIAKLLVVYIPLK